MTSRIRHPVIHGRLIAGLLVILALSQTGLAQADSQTEKLNRLQQTIKEITADISRTEQRRQQAGKDIEKFDRQIAENANKLTRLERDINSKNKQLNRLRGQKQEIRNQTRSQRRQLNRQARSAYLMGRQHPVKLILQEEDPSRLSRMLVYYDYFNRHRLSQLENLNEQLASLKQLEAQLKSETSRYQELVEQQAQQKRKLQTKRQQRQQLIDRLDKSLAKSQRRLNKLQADEQRLTKLTRAIHQAIKQDRQSTRLKFPRLKGKLNWPVRGAIKHRFGSRRPNGQLRWQGMVISAPSGTPVRAVADGRVVFADWLRGFGFLIIVDHGDNYMSLYGHNQQLFRKTGDKISKDDTLASVGNSGGQPIPALYFEIRHKGKAINPSRWMLARR